MAREGHSAHAISLTSEAGYDTINSHLKKVGIFKRNYTKNSKLTDDQRQEIIRKYVEDKMGATSLAREYGIDKRAIYCLLNRAGVGTRPRHDRVHGDVSVRSASGRKKGGWGSPPTIIDEHAFDTLTPEALYWLGFIAADGNIVDESNRSGKLSINLQSADADHLRALKVFFKAGCSVRVRAGHGFAGKTGYALMSFSCKRIYNRLMELSIMPGKGKLDDPFPPALVSSADFWRGLWDGDGSLTAANPYLAGTRQHLIQWKSFAHAHGVEFDKVEKTKTTHTCTVSAGYEQKLCKLLRYDTDSPMLFRKKVSANRIMCGGYSPSSTHSSDLIRSFPFILCSEIFEGVGIQGHILENDFYVFIDPHLYNADRIFHLTQKPARSFWIRFSNKLDEQGLHLRLIFPGDSLLGWKNLITHRYGQSGKLKGARSYTVSVIGHKDVRGFYDTAHIQGYRKGKHFALIDTASLDIMAALTIGFPKDCRAFNLNSKDHILLARFASLGNIPGACSRLLSAARVSRPERPVLTYSDPRYTDGELYRRLGFQLDSLTVPSYVYFKNGKQYSKEQLQKKHLSKLGASGGTETEMARSLGYLRLYDMGKRRWILT